MPTYPYGKKWRTIVTHNYKQKTKVTNTKREGEIWEAETLREMSLSVEEQNKKITFEFALSRYRDEVSVKKRGVRWEQIRINAFLASTLPIKKSIVDITPDDIGTWRNERAKTVKDGTIIRDLGFLSTIFEKCRKEWRYIKINPIKDVDRPEEPPHRDIVISRRYIRVMLTELGYKSTGPIMSVSQVVAMVFLVALRSGMRAGELCKLTWSRVESDYCVLPVTKTKKRDVPLTYKAIRLIKRMRGFDKELVFGIKPQTLDAMFRKYKGKAGLQDEFTFHDSRHTAATWLAPHIDVLTLCKMFGWSDPKEAMTYYNPTASDIAKRLNAKRKKA